MNPNLGALSGGYFHTTMRIPHGAPGDHTTQLDIRVPRGVLVVKPEVPDEWTASITPRALTEREEYLSHGRRVTTAPDHIRLRADSHAEGVHDDFLLNIDLQTKVGCVFEDAATNTLWNGEYTLWWRIDQVCEDDAGNAIVLSWNGTQRDRADGTSPPWSALPGSVHARGVQKIAAQQGARKVYCFARKINRT